jgi:hypothetical protein
MTPSSDAMRLVLKRYTPLAEENERTAFEISRALPAMRRAVAA